MDGKDVKLLGNKTSQYVWRIVWALKLKGIEFEFIEEDLFNKSPLLLEMNPVHKLIPVLIHGGKPICESLIILEYIDDTWKHNPILPKDPLQRAYARFWAKLADEKLLEGSGIAFFNRGKEQARGVEMMAEVLPLLEREIAKKKFFGGETIGYVDIVIGWFSYWLQYSQEFGDFKVMDSAKYPSIASWMNNILEVSVIKENLPPPDVILKASQKFRTMVLAMTSSKTL
ncbi:unnamed protein product [Ilex paraguariensis]|uniref:Probable glutathione S-transferase n=1 Tax=Ilex paraguariensis TaxID=185542 RepID=A0ABC8TKB1_9AQUA